MKLVLAGWSCFCFIAFLASSLFAGPPLDSSISTSNSLLAALEQISAERMLADITTLSGPAYRGRQTGSAQDEASASFVANRFSELRLHRSPASPLENRTNPLPQRKWKQTAPVPMRTITDDLLFELTVRQHRLSLRRGSDFLPVLDSPSADVRAPIVFVGYGLFDPAQGIDDYAGLDVRNKSCSFSGENRTSTQDPLLTLTKNGLPNRKAQSYLTATGPILSAYEQRRGATGKPGTTFFPPPTMTHQLPGASIRQGRPIDPSTGNGRSGPRCAVCKTSLTVPVYRNR